MIYLENKFEVKKVDIIEHLQFLRVTNELYLLNTVTLERAIRIFWLKRLLTFHSSKPPGIIYYTAESITYNEFRTFK